MRPMRGVRRSVWVAAIAASVGFAVGRSTAPEREALATMEQERVDLRRQERTDLPAPKDKKDRTVFVSPVTQGGEGKEAADRFCQSHGFAKAADFTCLDPERCDSFDLIVCDR